MKDDPEFNIRFVGLVEAHPCLYDNKRDDYHLNHVQERAWAQIAKDIGEGATSTECKGRWKNLRGSYTKHLKKYIPSGSGTSTKRPYYLAEYISFILPFTKSRQAKGNIEAPTKKQPPPTFDEEVFTDELETQDLDRENEKGRGEEDSQRNDNHEDPSLNEEVDRITSQEDLSASNQQDFLEESNPLTAYEGQPRTKFGKQKRVIQKSSAPLSEIKPKRNKIIQSKITLDDVNKSAFEYFEKKNQVPRKLPGVSTNDDADAHFLLSLLPDFKKMTDSQKRRFKVGILNLAGQILDETSSDITAPHPSAASTSNSSIMVNNMPLSRSSTACGHYTPSPIDETGSHCTYEDISFSKFIYSPPEQPSVPNTLNMLGENFV